MGRLTRNRTAKPIWRHQIIRRERVQGNIRFPVQLTTSRIGELTRLMHTLLFKMALLRTIHTCMNRYVMRHSPVQGKTPTNVKSVYQISLFYTERNPDQLGRAAVAYKLSAHYQQSERVSFFNDQQHNPRFSKMSLCSKISTFWREVYGGKSLDEL